MAGMIYRKRPHPHPGGYVEFENLQDGDYLTDIQALIVTLQDLDTSLVKIGNGTRDAA